ncbi:MAG: diaminopimelate epimerase [Stagnimonas sp.]|nr:diaminopimelate epimerase [Stagnimonas sp.]
MHFTKMHGCGNDFVVIDATAAPFMPTPALLYRLTDRRFGVGCDQVLVVQAPTSADIDFDYRIFNADGSEVGQCGNGSRALAVFIRQQGLSDKASLKVQTRTARMTLQLLDDGQVQVDMGVPRFAPEAIPLKLPAAQRYTLDLAGLGPTEFGVANFGNPHAVLFVPDVDAAPVEALGRALQAQPEFPESVNVGFLQTLSSTRARLRVYERGAGETLACGSGACAAFVVARQNGLLAETATLELRGGELVLHWAGDGHPVQMTGPAETVYTGKLEWPS